MNGIYRFNRFRDNTSTSIYLFFLHSHSLTFNINSFVQHRLKDILPSNLTPHSILFHLRLRYVFDCIWFLLIRNTLSSWAFIRECEKKMNSLFIPIHILHSTHYQFVLRIVKIFWCACTTSWKIYSDGTDTKLNERKKKWEPATSIPFLNKQMDKYRI